MTQRRAKPPERETRGKTAPNRLRRIDVLVVLHDPALLRRADGAYDGAWWVDLGYGASPVTTLESARHLRRIAPGLPVLGVESDPERVAAAQPSAGDGVAFRLGGFALPLEIRADGRRETARGLRAFNVLRQYDEADVAGAYTAMARSLLPGGLIVEGTSDPTGAVWTALLSRVTDPTSGSVRVERLIFGTNFRGPIEPTDFQAVLPKAFIHRALEDPALAPLLEDWRRIARDDAAAAVWGPRYRWHRMATALRQAGHDVLIAPRWLRRGFLAWTLPGVAGTGGS